MKQHLCFGAGVAALTVLPLFFLACSEDNGVTNPGTGGAAGSSAGGAPGGGMTGAGGAQTAGGMKGTGGAQAAGGATGTGGMMGTGGMPAPTEAQQRVCQARKPQDPGGMGAMNDMCCGGKGTCGMAAMGGPAGYGHDTCGMTLTCIPTSATLGDANAFKTCTTKTITSDP